MADRSTPTELVERLNNFYAVGTQAIVSRDGTVDKLLPHAVVAFFGTPYNEHDRERRAFEAARDTITGVREVWSGSPLVAAAVGAGTAFVGNVGTSGSRDYSAVGSIVDRTMALAAQAAPGQILLLPEAHAALSDTLVEALPCTIDVPGMHKPLHAWSVQMGASGTTPAVQRILVTILFLDLVGSTAISARIGDAAWRELLRRHYAELRVLLLRNDGTEIDTAGDGLLATFRSPAQAIAFAWEAIAADRVLGLDVRIGIHSGEVEKEPGGAIRGIAVVIAARIGALADAGQILVSGTVRDLAAGSGMSFADRGLHELKGIPQPRSVYEVEPAASL